jgi:hypothetical protein
LLKSSKWLKSTILLLGLSLYFFALWSGFGHAEPTGASITLIDSDTGAISAPDSRSDPGGSITTISLDAVQQNPGWKAYIGNITGRLVLRNSNGQSIYEWLIADSALSGNVFISRSASVNWTPLGCANNAQILSEDNAMGFSSASSDSINRTFNYSIHRAMIVSDVGTITASTCRSTATYVNDTQQIMDATNTDFQEILLSDGSSLIYGTFIDQDSWGFDNNGTNDITHDFQIIVADPKNVTDYTYYFYADIS